jgi:hypothetical protein
MAWLDSICAGFNSEQLEKDTCTCSRSVLTGGRAGVEASIKVGKQLSYSIVSNPGSDH